MSFGGGNNRFALYGDAVAAGKLSFGAGADTVTADGTSIFNGTVDFGGGADVLTLAGTAVFSGNLLNASAASVDVAGGALSIAGPVAVGSLSVGATGVLVATLEEQGRMTDAGRAAVEAARTDGRWRAAYAGPATRQAPDDLAAAIAAEPDARAMFDVLTSANRFALIHRVESSTESRARKITEMVDA